jgi:signal transduction histidine kinase
MSTSRRWWRAGASTIRVRLTLLYAGAFLLAGAVLVGLLYFFMAQALDRQLATRFRISDEQFGNLTAVETGSPRLVVLREELQVQFQQDRDHTLNTVLVASLIALAVVGVIAGGFGWFVAGQVLQPLQEITATARRVAVAGADRSLHERIALTGPNDEIKDLADTFDAMLERLDHAFNSQRRFVANASHELRTPLAINRTLIEVALDNPEAGERLRQLGTTLLAVNQRHERLIDGLLTLASSEQGVATRTVVDMAEVARHVVMECRAFEQEAGVDVCTDLQPAPVEGDPILLERLVQNLVDNAIRYNVPEGGWLAITTGVVNGFAQLVVENSGPLIPAYEVPGLFEPFRRMPDSERLAGRTNNGRGRGAGLGLSIVQAVTHAHEGSVQAAPRSDGGLTVRVRIAAVREKSAWNSA